MLGVGPSSTVTTPFDLCFWALEGGGGGGGGVGVGVGVAMEKEKPFGDAVTTVESRRVDAVVALGVDGVEGGGGGAPDSSPPSPLPVVTVGQRDLPLCSSTSS